MFYFVNPSELDKSTPLTFQGKRLYGCLTCGHISIQGEFMRFGFVHDKPNYAYCFDCCISANGYSNANRPISMHDLL